MSDKIGDETTAASASTSLASCNDGVQVAVVAPRSHRPVSLEQPSTTILRNPGTGTFDDLSTLEKGAEVAPQLEHNANRKADQTTAGAPDRLVNQIPAVPDDFVKQLQSLEAPHKIHIR